MRASHIVTDSHCDTHAHAHAHAHAHTHTHTHTHTHSACELWQFCQHIPKSLTWINSAFICFHIIIYLKMCFVLKASVLRILLSGTSYGDEEGDELSQWMEDLKQNLRPGMLKVTFFIHTLLVSFSITVWWRKTRIEQSCKNCFQNNRQRPPQAWIIVSAAPVRKRPSPLSWVIPTCPWPIWSPSI